MSESWKYPLGPKSHYKTVFCDNKSSELISPISDFFWNRDLVLFIEFSFKALHPGFTFQIPKLNPSFILYHLVFLHWIRTKSNNSSPLFFVPSWHLSSIISFLFPPVVILIKFCFTLFIHPSSLEVHFVRKSWVDFNCGRFLFFRKFQVNTNQMSPWNNERQPKIVQMA